MRKYSNSMVFALISLAPMFACGDDSVTGGLDANDEVGDGDLSESAGESAGDDVDESGTNGADERADTLGGDGDGDVTTDGSAGTSMTTGDGDGDTASTGNTMTTGDGDGDTASTGDTMTTGDGDGDMTTGDGDMTTGDGDMTTGDGDGDTSTDGTPSFHGQCGEDYDILNLADRNQQFNDGDGNVEWCDRLVGGVADLQWQGSGWYRFMGEAGTRMPTFPPLSQSCGTEAPGWMVGVHPGVDEGVVARTVCFSWSNDSCQWDRDIEVVACDGFYLYHLVNTSTCALRYCGTD